jgi:Spy/CpxP family protein refolding chaperone
MLTTPKAVEELGLSDEQVQAIRRLADEAAEELREEMQELRQKAEKRRAQGKAADVSELYRDFAEERREVAEEAMEGLKKVLTPEQRERARRWLDRTGPPGGPPPGPPPARPEPGPRPQTRPGPAPRYRGAEGARPETPAVPAVQEHPARFLLIEDAPAPEGGEQPRGERPRGARGPRPGGPPFGRGFGGTTEIGPEGQGILRLLRDEAVRGDLALTPDQQTMIEDLRKDAEKATERLRSSRPAPEPGATPAPEEGRRPARGNFGAMSEAFQKFRTEMAELDKIAWQALTETQRTKAREITRARATQERAARSPLGVLLGEEAVKDLGLTPEQVERIRAVLAETSDEQGRAWREQMEKMRDVPADQRRARFEEFARQREATRAERDAALKERVLVILTPAQQEKADKYFKEAEASRGRSIGRTVRRPGGGAAPAAGRPRHRGIARAG